MNVHFISLGCDKNLVDSEYMLGALKKNNYLITDDEQQADMIIVNTCCFVHDAKEESIETILEVSRLKEKGNLKALIVAGCLAQRYKEEILDEIKEVDAVVGTTAIDEIISVMEDVKAGLKKTYIKDINHIPVLKNERMTQSGAFTSYIKISEGCDKFCTYCIIPKLRGKHRSFPMEDLLMEAEELAKNGTKELIVIAQETTIYGTDLYGEKSLPKLLKGFCAIEGIEWVRLMYCYPEEITDELIQVIKEEDKICKYIDMPIQHASDSILKRMGRKTSKKDLMDVIGKLRKEIPQIVLRTTLITGFPGETEEDFEDLLDFVYQMNFERLGAFTYSPEEDTAAALMPNQIDEDVKEARKNAVMELQQDIIFDYMAEKQGCVMNVLIEGYIREEDIYVGRTYMDAPNIDGLIFVDCNRMLMSGEMILVEVTGSQGYDLLGTAVY